MVSPTGCLFVALLLHLTCLLPLREVSCPKTSSNVQLLTMSQLLQRRGAKDSACDRRPDPLH